MDKSRGFFFKPSSKPPFGRGHQVLLLLQFITTCSKNHIPQPNHRHYATALLASLCETMGAKRTRRYFVSSILGSSRFFVSCLLTDLSKIFMAPTTSRCPSAPH